LRRLFPLRPVWNNVFLYILLAIVESLQSIPTMTKRRRRSSWRVVLVTTKSIISGLIQPSSDMKASRIATIGIIGRIAIRWAIMNFIPPQEANKAELVIANARHVVASITKLNDVLATWTLLDSVLRCVGW
jgi:hypothetical protein